MSMFDRDRGYTTWWQKRGLDRDPEEMTIKEKDDAQELLLAQWLWGKGIDPVTFEKLKTFRGRPDTVIAERSVSIRGTRSGSKLCSL